MSIIWKDSMMLLMEDGDFWLKSCAIYCCVDERDPEIMKMIVNASKSTDPVVRETAELVLKKQKKQS